MAPKNRPFQGDSLRLLQWNCGGLSQSKKAELSKIISTNKIDVFILLEANKTTEDMENFQFPGYTSHILEKHRQIASGIVVGVKRNMIADFKIIKSMGSTDDKMEMINLHIWKASQSFSIYATYNPPNNKANFDIINVNRKTILIGDFNSPSVTWGYNYTTPPGDILEDFISSAHLQLIYNPTDPPTSLHYNGKGTNPDLLFVSSDIFDNRRSRKWTSYYHSKYQTKECRSPPRSITSFVELSEGQLAQVYQHP